MSNIKKLMMSAAGDEALNVEDVFSTYLYHGTQTQVGGQTITNNIDLATEGGMVWFKARNAFSSSTITDTEMGAGNYLETASTAAKNYSSTYMTSFNTDGFTLGAFSGFTNSDLDYVSWTFRKAPKFFDVVTYTGNGTSSRTVSHNLGSVPGMIIVKNLDSSFGWNVYHRMLSTAATSPGASPETDYLRLHVSDAALDDSSAWNDTAPTDSVFTLGGSNNINNDSYVAYLFAHNDGDGEFGTTGDQDIIKCGNYTGNNGYPDGYKEVELGFQPQFLLVKKADGNGDWFIADSMRGIVAEFGTDPLLRPNSSSTTYTSLGDTFELTATGFRVNGSSSALNSGGSDYIYMAIRRGTKIPESGADVFAAAYQQSGATYYDPPSFTAGFTVDMAIVTRDGDPRRVNDRLRGPQYVTTDGSSAQTGDSLAHFGYQDGYRYGYSAYFGWMWKRAPHYLDIVNYEGDGSSGNTVTHGLGVAPEMIWVKRLNQAGSWSVYHASRGATKNLVLDTASNETTSSVYWNDTAPTDEVFSLGNSLNVNGNGSRYIAYLFATLSGVSKVGSFSGNGASQTIDCGFSSGARFILIKSATSASSGWLVWDSVRGIVAGDDPYFDMSSTANAVTNTDIIDPNNSGFTVNTGASINTSGAEYIFYAVA